MRKTVSLDVRWSSLGRALPIGTWVSLCLGLPDDRIESVLTFIACQVLGFLQAKTILAQGEATQAIQFSHWLV